MQHADAIITNARVVTCAGLPQSPSSELGIIDKGAVVVEDGRITFVGDASQVDSRRARHHLDAQGRVLLPGLIDPHTHSMFAGSRIDEFAARRSHHDYLDQAQQGGGIQSTVRATRQATAAELIARTEKRLAAMLAHGVSTVEVKSGYGLSYEAEIAMLENISKLSTPQNIIPTFLGAHVVPEEYRQDPDEYVGLIAQSMIPVVAERALAHGCDVYLDDGAFNRAQANMILACAKSYGLHLRAHVGQFTDQRGAEMLADLEALSADHLEHVSDEGLAAMAAAGTVAVLLPGAWITLGQQPPDVERIRAFGVKMALGTDCNPGTSPCTDLPLCAALAVRQTSMSCEEAILAMTVMAAQALGLSTRGQIRVGHVADLALYETDDPRMLAYALGDVRARLVLIAGQPVFSS